MRAPWFGKSDEAVAARAASAVAARTKRGANPLGDPAPQKSALQKKAATRVKGLFENDRDSRKFRERFNAGWNPVRAHTPEMAKLDQALQLADEVDKANGVQHSRYAAEQRAAWRKSLGGAEGR